MTDEEIDKALTAVAQELTGSVFEATALTTLSAVQRAAESIEKEYGLWEPALVGVYIAEVNQGGVYYARAQHNQPVLNGKNTQGLGIVGSSRHTQYQLRIQHRDLLQELKAVKEVCLEEFKSMAGLQDMLTHWAVG